MKAIIVCGSREWSDRKAIWSVLDAVDVNILIEGGARGADSHARHWARDAGAIDVVTMPARWEQGPSAGPVRNAAMLRVLLALQECGYTAAVHAFVLPSSRGTWDTVNRAKKAGVLVHVHRGEL